MSSTKSKTKMMKLLKENERQLMDVERRLAEQLDNLKKEEIYLRTIIIKEKEEGDDEFGEEDDGRTELDDDNMNKAPLEHLNTATSKFYQMFTGKEPVIEVNEVEDDDEEEEEEDSDDGKKTEEEQSAEFQRLMSSMQGDG